MSTRVHERVQILDDGRILDIYTHNENVDVGLTGHWLLEFVTVFLELLKNDIFIGPAIMNTTSSPQMPLVMHLAVPLKYSGVGNRWTIDVFRDEEISGPPVLIPLNEWISSSIYTAITNINHAYYNETILQSFQRTIHQEITFLRDIVDKLCIYYYTLYAKEFSTALKVTPNLTNPSQQAHGTLVPSPKLSLIATTIIIIDTLIEVLLPIDGVNRISANTFTQYEPGNRRINLLMPTVQRPLKVFCFNVDNIIQRIVKDSGYPQDADEFPGYNHEEDIARVESLFNEAQRRTNITDNLNFLATMRSEIVLLARE